MKLFPPGRGPLINSRPRDLRGKAIFSSHNFINTHHLPSPSSSPLPPSFPSFDLYLLFPLPSLPTSSFPWPPIPSHEFPLPWLLFPSHFLPSFFCHSFFFPFSFPLPIFHTHLFPSLLAYPGYSGAPHFPLHSSPFLPRLFPFSNLFLSPPSGY